MRKSLLFVTFASLGFSMPMHAFEDAQVLPAGVRRVELKYFHAILDSRTDSNGIPRGLGNQLEKNITYNDFIGERQGAERRQLEGFLKSNQIDKQDAVGSLKADVKGALNVIAPTFGYGFTDTFSFGIAVPYYSAVTDTKVGFNPNSNADRFVGLLADPKVGLSHKAVEAVDAINGVTDTLDEKLERSGYKKLGRWDDAGLGDVILKGKYQALDTGVHRFATDFGGRLPTGKTDDPDILTDVQFGDGTFDLFTGVIYDYRLVQLSPYTPFFINTFAKYTYQAPSARTIRMKTATEVIEVPKKNVAYKLGDFVDAGVSLQLDTYAGLVGGVGYQYFYKMKDKYEAGESSRFYEEDSRQWAHKGEAMIGYSSVNAFRRGAFFMPFTSYLVYERQLKSVNMPVQHLVELDLKFYF